MTNMIIHNKLKKTTTQLITICYTSKYFGNDWNDLVVCSQ